MADMKARQLIKQVPNCSALIDFTGGINIDIDADYSGSGWEVIAPYGTNIRFLVWRGYIDLAGYTKEDLTFFTQAVDIQRGANQLAGPTVLHVTTHDLITTRRLRDSECNPYEGFLTFSEAEGLDLQELIFGEWVTYVPYASAYPTLRPIKSSNVGTGNPTAADRLHITRVIEMAGTGETNAIWVSGTNYIIGGVTSKEKDLVYIERLRRAYTQDAGRNV